MKILNILIIVLYSLAVVGVLIGCVWSLWEIIRNKAFAWSKLCVIIAIVFSFFLEANDLVRPVMNSGRIEINYDLGADDFKDGEANYLYNGQQYRLKRIETGGDNHYRIYMPHKIKDWFVLYTSYDASGTHLGRAAWELAADYDVSDNYIESRHNLNEGINGGRGRHLFVYSYRGTLKDFFRDPIMVLKERFQ